MKTAITLSKAKKVICFIAAVLLTAATVSACTTDLKNTSSAGQGAQVSKTESSLVSKDSSEATSYDVSMGESSDSTSEESFDPSKIAPTVVTQTGKDAPVGFKSIKISFKDTRPLDVEFVIPENWTAKADNTNTIIWGSSPCYQVIFYDGEKEVGSIINDTFEITKGYESDVNYRMIYTYLRVRAFDWTDEYRELKSDSNSGVAVTRIAFYPMGGESGETRYEEGILSYDISLLKFVALKFEKDLLSKEQLEKVANSIKISASK